MGLYNIVGVVSVLVSTSVKLRIYFIHTHKHTHCICGIVCSIWYNIIYIFVYIYGIWWFSVMVMSLRITWGDLKIVTPILREAEVGSGARLCFRIPR